MKKWPKEENGVGEKRSHTPQTITVWNKRRKFIE